MIDPDLCTEDEIRHLVHAFYAKVRDDERLGPIFAAQITDWDHHLGKMVDFWSSTLRGTARYRGTPMPRHAALPGLEPALFQRWLSLFRETTAEMDNAAMRERANELAERIAESLWFGYQMARDPDRIAARLEARAAHARTRQAP